MSEHALNQHGGFCAECEEPWPCEVTRLRELVRNADSMLSLIRHRGNVRWGGDGFAESYEVDHLIGELRRASQS